MYHLVKQVQQLYELLQDDLSKDIFEIRLICDIEPSMKNAMCLLCLKPHQSEADLRRKRDWKDQFQMFYGERKKIILYGTGETGRAVAQALMLDQIDFFGFCGRRASAFPDGLMGKPVIAPRDLFEYPEQYAVLVAADLRSSVMEIQGLLEEHKFPRDHILDIFDVPDDSHTYFEFPSLYHKGTAFIDGGCFDCKDDYIFSEWCNGQYSNIIAFEPDPTNYDNCLRKLESKPIPNLRLIQAAMSDCSGTVEFASNGSVRSRILGQSTDESTEIVEEKIKIQTVTIDDVMENQTVGFIKMDIEGAEMDALRGAKQAIYRDKPLLAISVYHRQGDMLAIMEELHRLVPEYRFWLRHYGRFMGDTVLYASVDSLR